MKIPNQDQRQFFEYLIKRKSKEEVLNSTMDILHLKKGAAYKRINGDSALLSQEMINLSSHFGFSIDTALGSQQFMSFEHPFMGKGSSIDFLERYSFYLHPLSEGGQSSLAYVANEIPVFYYFSHKYIFNFLLSVWNHLHWEETSLTIAENQSITPQLEILRNKVAKYYDSQPVTEIWNSNMLSNLYQQIIFSITIRAFKEVTFIPLLIKDISNLIANLKKLTEDNIHQGNDDKNNKIYLNEFGNFMNMAIYKSEKLSTTFVGYDMPHFMVSYNKRFYDFSNNWVEKIKRRSVLISGQGYQFRELFFLKITRDFEVFKDRVDKLLPVYY